MKKTFFLFILFLLPILALAQDKIITSEGDVIVGFNIDISTNSIYYKTTDGDNAELKSIPKADVLMIKYADGTKVMIGEETPAAEAAAPSETQIDMAPVFPNGLTQITINDLSPEIFEQNKARIDHLQKPIKRSPVEKHLKKDASFARIRYFARDSSVFIDENIELDIRVGTKTRTYEKEPVEFANTNGGTLYDPAIRIWVKNKADYPIYIDLRNTWYYAMGVLHNMVHTKQVSNTVTSASNIVSTTTSYAEETVTMIPPRTELHLVDFYLFTNTEQWVGTGMYYNYDSGALGFAGKGRTILYVPKKSDKGPFKYNDTINYTWDNSPSYIGYHVTYSFDPEFKGARKLVVNLYLGEIIGEINKEDPIGRDETLIWYESEVQKKSDRQTIPM